MNTKAAAKPWSFPRRNCAGGASSRAFPLKTTAQAELREGFIGQERALRALKMGAELSAPGYNVFVCGLAAPAAVEPSRA